MPVDGDVPPRRFVIRIRQRKQRSDHALFSAERMVQVIIRIIRLHDGIIHVRPRNPQPRDKVGILRQICGQVHRSLHRLFADCVFGLLNGQSFFRQRNRRHSVLILRFFFRGFTCFCLLFLLPKLLVFACFRAHLRVPLQHGQDDGEHTADEQQRRQKGKRGKGIFSSPFISFHTHSLIQNKGSLFQAVPRLFDFLLFHFLLNDADGVRMMI